jgi:hypothetical protein
MDRGPQPPRWRRRELHLHQGERGCYLHRDHPDRRWSDRDAYTAIRSGFRWHPLDWRRSPDAEHLMTFAGYIRVSRVARAGPCSAPCQPGRSCRWLVCDDRAARATGAQRAPLDGRPRGQAFPTVSSPEERQQARAQVRRLRSATDGVGARGHKTGRADPAPRLKRPPPGVRPSVSPLPPSCVKQRAKLGTF